MAQFRGTAKNTSPAILFLGALLAILTATAPAWSQTTYVITNASGSANMERCLIFGGNNQERFPSRYLWTNSNPEYCGFSSEQQLLQNGQAVWNFTRIEGDNFIIRHSSPNGARSECLIFSNNNKDQFPSRYLWGSGANAFCGFSSKAELLGNKQAIWKLKALDDHGHYLILHTSSNNTRDQCLIFGGNGNEANPSRFLWGNGSGDFCGFPTKDELLRNKQAVWTIRRTDVGPDCKSKPFAYDNGPAGQPSWCGVCNKPGDIDQVRLQSPINIKDPKPTAGLPQINFNYENTPLKYLQNANNLKVEGNGYIVLGDLGKFKLKEFHFHRPSEEAVNNHRSAMVIHLVHENEAHDYAVVSVLVEESPAADSATGEATELIEKLIQNFPPPLGPRTVEINAAKLLPSGNRDYYRYSGSLTTPPCTEGVTFYVLKTPILLPRRQIDELARRYPSPSARDIQETNGRVIEEKTN
jgi:carbonic anhydrase